MTNIKVHYHDQSWTEWLDADWLSTGNFLIILQQVKKIVIPLEKVTTFEIIQHD